MAFLFHSKYFDPEVWRSAIHGVDPSVDFRTLDQIGDPAEIECLMAWRPPPGTFPRLSNLKLIYSTGAGVDGLLSDPERPKGIPVARVFDSQQARDMRNFVIGAVLRHHLRFDFYQRQQLEKAWHIAPHVPTTSRRVGIMGLGKLGGAAAEHLARLGFQVAGWTRQRTMDIQDVNCYTGESGLGEFLVRTDILVCMLPLTPETRHIVNGRLLSSLPKGAAFINVGRGAHVIERDLLSALNEHLSGATLDVFEQEPLPESHPFWKHPKVFITPHVATFVNPDSAAPEVVANYNRIKTGEAFANIVDEVRGY